MVASATNSGFLGSLRECRAERILETASPQRRIVEKTSLRFTMPIPEMMMSAGRPFSVKGSAQDSGFRTSPWEIVRWVSMADSGTPFWRSMVVSLEGVRATGKASVGVGQRGNGTGRTRCAVIAGFESWDQGGEGRAARCAVEGDEGFW